MASVSPPFFNVLQPSFLTGTVLCWRLPAWWTCGVVSVASSRERRRHTTAPKPVRGNGELRAQEIHAHKEEEAPPKSLPVPVSHSIPWAASCSPTRLAMSRKGKAGGRQATLGECKGVLTVPHGLVGGEEEAVRLQGACALQFGPTSRQQGTLLTFNH